MLKNILKKLKLGHLTLKKYLRAEKALENKDWEGLAEITEQIHTEGVPLAITRFWRGSALLHLNRNEEAILEFERIDGKLDTIEEEASRHWNHVLALYRTGRKNESYELLMKKINPDWPTETFWKARRFLTEAGFEAFRIKV